MSRSSTLKEAFLLTIPVMMGYLVLGVAFGLLLQNGGYHWLWATLASLVVYAGSMQFVLVGLLTQQAPLLTVAITTLLVNSRHLFYGLSFIERFKAMGRRGLYMVFSLTDETYALLCSVDERASDTLIFTIAILNQAYWVIGSTLGALAGSYITISLEGIEFAMTALFTTILVEQLLERKNRIPALIGFVCAAGALAWLGPAQFLLPALGVTVVLLLLLRPRLEVKG